MDYNEYKNNLNWLQKMKIHHQHTKFAGKISDYEIDEAGKDLETDIRRNKNKRDMLELKDELKQMKLQQEIELLKTKGMLELKQSSSKCTKVKRLENRGAWFKGLNITMVVISCITSMLGFGMIESGLDAIPLIQEMLHCNYLNCLVLGVIFLVVQFLTSLFVGSLGDINTFFKDNKQYALITIIAFVYAVSIYSNYGFWITLTNSKFVAGFYSFLIDSFTILTSIYSEKFIDQNSKKIQEFLHSETENITLVTTQNLPSKTDENTQVEVIRKTTSIDGKKGVYEPQEVPKLESNLDCKKDENNLIHDSKTKGVNTYQKLEKEIEKLEDGTVISPKLFNLQGNKNYYNWIKKCSNATKNIDGKWVKKNSNVIELKKAGNDE